MKILRFIAWWWEDIGTGDQIAVGIVGTFVSIVVGTVFFGPKFVLGLLAMFIIGLLFFLVYSVARVINRRWKKYNQLVEKEQQLVIDRLSGNAPRSLSLLLDLAKIRCSLL